MGNSSHADAAAFRQAAVNGQVGIDPDAAETVLNKLRTGKDAVEVGRIRKDFSIDHGLNLWVCGDQIRKGAALNALQIAEYMIANGIV